MGARTMFGRDNVLYIYQEVQFNSEASSGVW